MARVVSMGNCYLCGRLISKGAFKKHVLTAHPLDTEEQAQECIVLKVEDTDTKMYWLYLDIAASSTLKTLDTFLRKIWLECCGHMSAFYDSEYGNVAMSQKIVSFSPGTSLLYEYDFGATTQLRITIVGFSWRPKQRKAVRLIGRNEAYHFQCRKCCKEAGFICLEYLWANEDPFFCEACSEEEDMLLPVVNSPRMGVCDYCGDLDEYEFDPSIFE